MKRNSFGEKSESESSEERRERSFYVRERARYEIMRFAAPGTSELIQRRGDVNGVLR